MNQIKYSAYALLLVLGITSVALFVNNLSFPRYSQQSSIENKPETTEATKPIINVAGKNLFQSNCQTCHALDRTLSGPALAGVESRGPWTDRKNLLKWVKNPAAMINTLPYTKELFRQYNGQVMPSFSHLDDKQIENIFDYIKEADGTP